MNESIETYDPLSDEELARWFNAWEIGQIRKQVGREAQLEMARMIQAPGDYCEPSDEENDTYDGSWDGPQY